MSENLRRSFWQKASLQTKFLWLIVPLLLFVTLALFFVFNNFAQQEAQENLQSRMGNVVAVQSRSIAGPVWVLNDQEISLVATAMVLDPDIQGVEVLDERGVVLGLEGMMDSEEEALRTIEQAILFTPRVGTEPQNIGTLRVAYSANSVEEQRLERLYFTLTMAAVMTLIAVGGAVLALRTAVKQPLGLFLDSIQQTRGGDEDQSFEWDHDDEIGKLASAYNELQSSQIKFRNELADIRDQLEIRVSERTKDLQDREAQLVRARDEAEGALDSLQKTQQQLIESEKLASLGQLTAGIAHEIKNPLNFVNNFADLSRDLLTELLKEIDEVKAKLPADSVTALDDVSKMLTTNLSKITEHGQRADSIVKNMLAHSREAPDAKAPTDLNKLAKEAMALVYHGLRAEKLGFNINMELDLDPDMPVVPCYPQELQRAIMNILMNGMQATSKHHTGLGDASKATVEIRTKATPDGHAEIEIFDNGPGISRGLESQIYNPFFTTKPAGEGTGLGLSMSYDIVFGRHGGEIVLESTEGEFTKFLIRIPIEEELPVEAHVSS